MTALDEKIAAVATTPRLLVALDFDGTLSPLQDDPMQSRMLPVARDAVEALAALPDTIVALVSGRSLVDLRLIAEHDDDSALWLAGSHGAEFWEPGIGAREPEDDSADVALRDRLRAHAEQATAELDGVWIEPKTFGLGVHTRRADPAAAAEANRIVDELVRTEASAWRRRTGRDIVEYAFRHEGKDTAVAVLRERTGATAVLFAGDDVTDEDALRSLGEGDLGVRVGAGDTAASVTVADITEFAGLLNRIAELRAAR
ncbi:MULTISPECIES: trehalose-phosphatase [unclassified Microbacterium]|uniref:trehalose-phosphatase n=1 Tax=unclassified Microbacterium TaxID=2609290 RepID=UPI00214C8A56|nr:MULTISPECIES: trehalose-phosphatase [unclassified Microbacterium]MCR2784574.1 trehalose-phosphatase [Microbacterium sp. zg.B96]MDL5350507.1 trehalose-phosphatase [Microbacterium sp. zg-YB36]WIM14617.1 trehalose-phosphatase [Microbacterium sp. zg-B96]